MGEDQLNPWNDLNDDGLLEPTGSYAGFDVPSGNVGGQGVATGIMVPYVVSHADWGTGLSSTEVHRISVPAGYSLEVRALDLQLQGGGSTTNLTVDVVDNTNATTLASTTAGGAAEVGQPIGTSGDGVVVIVQMSNSTGNPQTGSLVASLALV